MKLDLTNTVNKVGGSDKLVDSVWSASDYGFTPPYHKMERLLFSVCEGRLAWANLLYNGLWKNNTKMLVSSVFKCNSTLFIHMDSQYKLTWPQEHYPHTSSYEDKW